MNKSFVLFLMLSVLLNVVTIILLAGAFGVLPGITVSKPVGISAALVCAVLSSVSCLTAIRLNRK
ncbi:MAG: hypothetical protein K6A33_10565 [Clostridiales bacterium]|nr:hypothetical protein [Clostridiales bacterium]